MMLLDVVFSVSNVVTVLMLLTVLDFCQCYNNLLLFFSAKKLSLLFQAICLELLPSGKRALEQLRSVPSGS